MNGMANILQYVDPKAPTPRGKQQLSTAATVCTNKNKKRTTIIWSYLNVPCTSTRIFDAIFKYEGPKILEAFFWDILYVRVVYREKYIYYPHVVYKTRGRK